MEIVLDLGTPPVVNDSELFARMKPTLERVTTLNDLNPQTVAEDFSLYGLEAPSLFLFLGNTPPGVDPSTQPANHSPLFTMHEPNMQTGVRAFSHMVVDFLRAE